MKSPGARSAATILLPAAIILAVLFVAASGAFPVIPEGPLQGGGGAARSRGWLEFSGFYPAELENDHSFSWMGAAGRIRLPRLDRSAAWRLSLHVQPAAVDRPVELTATVDGLALPAWKLLPGPQQIDIDLPPRPIGRAVITLSVSQTMVPGGNDVRPLGMRVGSIRLDAADGRFRMPGESWRDAVVIGVALGVAIMLTIGAGPLALAVAAAAGGWLGFLLVRDGSLLGPYADHVQVIALVAAALAALVALLTRPARAELWSPRIAAGVVIIVSVCKLALFFHPMVNVGDSIFHVHRAQVVQQGEYFFTSITPKPFFEFPYPPGLYVAVAPLWRTFPTEMEHVRLLRAAVIAAEGLLALAIYGLVMANWKDRLTAFLACALTLLVPVGFYTICTSNLTNSMAQSLFGTGMAALLCAHTRRGMLAAAAGAALLAAAFLSHFSTFSIGVPLVFVCAVAVSRGGAGAARRTAIALALALAIAATASVAVYYSHFMPVYRQTLARVLAREGEAAERSMAAPAQVKASRAARMVWGEFGPALLLGALMGAAQLLRSRAKDPLTLGLAAWAVVVVGFWLLGIVTAVEMRASLAALPLAAILAAAALAGAARGSAWTRALGAAALTMILVHALVDWCGCLGIERFLAM